MGSGSYSAAFYADRSETLLRSKGTTFTHDDDIKTGKVAKEVHSRLDVKGKRRESRDSAEHPNATPVGIMFDVTGSMARIPQVFQTKMATLLSLLTKHNVVPDPQVLFAAVGDATCDSVPFQAGQFESDNRMDEDLSMFFLEGGGGGQNTESYELGMYFFAKNVDADCWQKHNRKGYLVIIGDERYYPDVKKTELERILGVTVQEDVPTRDVAKALKQKYNVIVFIPAGASNSSDPESRKAWKALFGENVFDMENVDDVCAEIAVRIGLIEGTFKDRDKALSAMHAVQKEVDVLVETAKSSKVAKPAAAGAGRL